MDNTHRFVRIDFQGHKDQLLRRIRSRWSDGWNDFVAGSFGVILVDLIAWSTSTLAYIVNRLVAENFLPTMSQRDSAIRFGALTGYKLKSAVPASVLCDAVAPSPVSGTPLIIAAGSQVSVVTALGLQVTFEVSQQYTIAVGQTRPRAVVLNISPTAIGVRDITTTLTAVVGQPYLDLTDSTLDAASYLQQGQTIEIAGYAVRIVGFTAPQNGAVNSRILIDVPWPGSAGQSSAVVVDNRIELVQGLSYVETFTVPEDGAGFIARLSRKGVAWQSASVTVNGVLWNRVTNLFAATASDLVFEEKQSGDLTIIAFGDGVFGASAPASATVEISYRVGGGVSGNVPAGSVNANLSARSGANQVSIQISNPYSGGQGGLDREGLSDARRNIPRYTRANARGVTTGDLESLAIQYSGRAGSVTRARAISRASANVMETNLIVLYAWTTGANGVPVTANAALQSELQKWIALRAIGTDKVIVAGGKTTPAPVAVRVRLQQGADSVTTAAAVKSTIANYIVSTPGSAVVVQSDLLAAIDGTAGVASVDVCAPARDTAANSALELYTTPSAAEYQTIAMTRFDEGTYYGNIGFQVLSPWGLKIKIGGEQITVLPGMSAAQAELLGNSAINGLASTTRGLDSAKGTPTQLGAIYRAWDTARVYRSVLASSSTASNPTYVWRPTLDGGNYLDLATGRLVISYSGVPTLVEVALEPVTVYDSVRSIDIMIGYSGVASLSVRSDIRRAIRHWFSCLQVGSSVFCTKISSAPASASNLADAVSQVVGVTATNSVSAAGQSRVDASASELLVPGAIAINGFYD